MGDQKETRDREHYLKTYQFDVEVAQEHGVDESIILWNLQFWIKTNRANGDHFNDGRTWHYGSVKSFAELWPFWTPKHISRKLNGLIKAGVLVKGNYNKSGYDRTIWYSFKDEKSWFLGRDTIIHKRQMERTKMGNRFSKSGIPVPNQSQHKSPNRSQRQRRIGNSLSEKKSLGLVIAEDKALAESKKRLAETILRLLPPVTGREKTTFRHILDYLVHGCETGKFGIEIFEQAEAWIREARVDGIKPKNLFVHIIKERTGFAAKQKKPLRADSKNTCDGDT